MSASIVPPLRASRSSVEEQLSREGITVVGTNLVDNHGCSKAVSRWVRGKSGDMDRDSRLGDKDEGDPPAQKLLLVYLRYSGGVRLTILGAKKRASSGLIALPPCNHLRAHTPATLDERHTKSPDQAGMDG